MVFSNIRHTLFSLVFIGLLTTVHHAYAQTLYVGGLGNGVTSTITSGTNAYTNIYIGVSSSSNPIVTTPSSNNTLIVSESGTVLTSSTPFFTSGGSGNLIVGSNSSGNTLIISNGASLLVGNQYPGYAYIGNGNNSYNNSVIVTGSSSLWSNSYDVSINPGIGNCLNILDGGKVLASNGISVNSLQPVNNYSIFVSGSNSSLSTTSLIFGESAGNSGSMSINGGTVTDLTASIGGNTGGYNNHQIGNGFVTISTGIWSNSTQLNIGNGGAGTLTINGGSVYGNQDTIGYDGSGIVTVNSGLWSNLILSVGFYGNATLMINGGNVTNSAAVNLGSYYGNGNASVTVNNGFLSTPSIYVNRVGVMNIGSNGIISVTTGITNLYSFSSLTINFGSIGGTDFIASNALSTPSIAFGSGTGTINFNQANSYTLTSSISGNGTINQLGMGTTTITASNSFSGSTYVSSGTLLIASSGTLPGSIMVSQGANLQNNGILGASSISGTLSGNGGSFSNLVLNQGSSLIWNINSFTGTAGTNWDVLNAFLLDLSSLSSTNRMTIYIEGISGTGNTNRNYSFNFLDVTNGITGFDPSRFTIDTTLFTIDPSLAAGAWSIGTNSVNGATALTLVYAVPEPSTYVLFALSLGAMVIGLRKRRICS